MALIPGGEFLRGRSHPLPDDALKWFPDLLRDDRPVRPIHVDAFRIDRHEVTNAEYLRFVESSQASAPYHWPQGRPPEGQKNFPVVNVTWEEAAAYCRWAGKRLPTEAEWEKACRGGAEKAKFPWGDEEASKQRAHYDSVGGPQAVGSFPPNSYGLYDMAGNAWEWTSDWYAKDYYAEAPGANPRGPESGMYRVLRGGSWADEPKYLTCAHRSFARPAERSPNIGLRCAAGAGESP